VANQTFFIINMLKRLFVGLLATANALEAMLSVSPDTVSKVSSLRMMISFDESLGKGGLISLIVPDSSTKILQQGFN
jgi:hypothetical protein